MATVHCLITNNLHTIFFFVQEKEIHTGLEQHEGEVTTELSFLVELSL